MDSVAETSLVDEIKQDMQTVRGNLEWSFSDGDIQGNTVPQLFIQNLLLQLIDI